MLPPTVIALSPIEDHVPIDVMCRWYLVSYYNNRYRYVLLVLDLGSQKGKEVLVSAVALCFINDKLCRISGTSYVPRTLDSTYVRDTRYLI